MQNCCANSRIVARYGDAPVTPTTGDGPTKGGSTPERFHFGIMLALSFPTPESQPKARLYTSVHHLKTRGRAGVHKNGSSLPKPIIPHPRTGRLTGSSPGIQMVRPTSKQRLTALYNRVRMASPFATGMRYPKGLENPWLMTRPRRLNSGCWTRCRRTGKCESVPRAWGVPSGDHREWCNVFWYLPVPQDRVTECRAADGAIFVVKI